MSSLAGTQELPKKKSPRRLRDVAYERLKDAIRDQEFQPGQPLSETYLSQLLGISRTPVREAVQQLAQEGLLQVIPGRAVTVATPSVQGVLDVMHVRSLLEPEVARLVAEAPGPEMIEALRNALAKMQRAAEQMDKAAWTRADTEWHEIIARACPNRLLGELALQMRNRSHSFSADNQTSPARIIDCTAEHRAVVDAIEARDLLAAERAMRQHLERVRQGLFRRLTQSYSR